MPKLIDYPRTTYAGAWELGEIVDDTGGKCAIDTAARKLNRKVSGSFKAIIGSAVKFGLMTSKRDLLSTTTLFRRIKHAYDKQEELLFHREAFLTPPLFTQLCRKFRTRELPIQMLDVMLIREFGVEEINAQGVARAFIEGARMVGLLDEHNMVTDIDQLAAQQPPRRELASPQPTLNTFRSLSPTAPTNTTVVEDADIAATAPPAPVVPVRPVHPQTRSTDLDDTNALDNKPDAIASLFGLSSDTVSRNNTPVATPAPIATKPAPRETTQQAPGTGQLRPTPAAPQVTTVINQSNPINTGYHIQLSGAGVNTTLSISDEDDILLVQALLEKIRRQLKTQ